MKLHRISLFPHWVLGGMLVACGLPAAFAEAPGLPEPFLQRIEQIERENASLRAELRDLKEVLGRQGIAINGSGARDEEAGMREGRESPEREIRLGGAANAVFGHTLGAGDEDTTVYGVSGDLFFEADVTERTSIFLNLEYSRADTADSVIGSAMGLNDDAAFQTVGAGPDGDLGVMNVREFWLEHDFRLLGKDVTISAGKIDITNYTDLNGVANDENTQFISSPFVNGSAFGTVAPTNTPGLRVTLHNIFPESFSNHLEGSLTWGFESRDDSGMDLLNDPFNVLSLDLVARVFEGRPTHFEILGYQTGSERETGPPGTGLTGGDNGLYGLGFSAHQPLSDRVTAFGRYGMNERELAAPGGIRQAFSLGFAITDPLALDREDVFGAGYAWAEIEDDTIDDFWSAAPEHMIEIYYRYHVNEAFTISPFLQAVGQAGARDDGVDAVVIGSRIHADF